MDKLVVVGVDPPCPRCGLLSEIIETRVKELGIRIEISHWVYTDNLANTFAKAKGEEL